MINYIFIYFLSYLSLYLCKIMQYDILTIENHIAINEKD